MSKRKKEKNHDSAVIGEIQLLHSRAKELAFSQPHEALKLAMQSVDLAHREEQKGEEGYALLVVGLAHFMLNAHEEAHNTWVRALAVFCTIGNDTGTMECMSNLGNYFLSRSDFPVALQWYEKVLHLSQKLGNVYREVSTLNNMGTVSKALGEYPKAVAYHKQALELAEEKLDEPQALASVCIIAFNNLAGLYWELGDVVDAVEYFTHALHLVQQVGDKHWEAGLLNNIGSVYEAMDNSTLAVEYYQQGIALARQLGHDHNVLLPLINIASVFRKQKRQEEAKQYLEEALALARSCGARTEEALALGNIGIVHEEWHEYSRAEEYLHQALELYRELGAREGEMKVLSALGKIYVLQGDTTRALPVLQQALGIAEHRTMKTRLFEIYGHLAAAYKLLGDYERALVYHERYHDAERDVFNEEMDKCLQRLMIQLQMERTEHERELYRSKAELLEQEVEFKRRELASHALHLVERDKLIRTTERFLEKLQGAVSAEEAVELKKVLRMLKNSRQDTPGWDVFDEKFQELHGEFTGRLTSLYPSLSPSEVKVCVLTKLHLSTKEIAAVLHTGVRTVEAHRYRLRKKLSLDGEVNLVLWLSAL